MLHAIGLVLDKKEQMSAGTEVVLLNCTVHGGRVRKFIPLCFVFDVSCEDQSLVNIRKRVGKRLRFLVYMSLQLCCFSSL